MHGGFLLLGFPSDKWIGDKLYHGKCELCVQIYISISSRGDTAHPEQFRCSSLEVKDVKGQNLSQWQLSSIPQQAAVKANKLWSSAFAPDLKAEKGIHA